MERLIKDVELLTNDRCQGFKNLMGNYNISFAELGRELGVSRQSIFDTLHGDNMYLSTFLNICKKLEELIEERTSQT